MGASFVMTSGSEEMAKIVLLLAYLGKTWRGSFFDSPVEWANVSYLAHISTNIVVPPTSLFTL